MKGAAGYELERDETQLFAVAESIYKGSRRDFTDVSVFSQIATTVHYRVRATSDDGLNDSEWSNVVVFKRPWLGLSPLGGRK